MSFSWSPPQTAQELADRAANNEQQRLDGNQRATDQRVKDQANRASQLASDADNTQRANGARQVSQVTDALAQKKALDLANKQTADYKAGVVSSDEGNKLFAEKKASDKLAKQKANYAAGITDPNDAQDEAQARNQKVDAAKTDIQRYTEKSDYDLGNQGKAWRLASELKQSDANQANVAQKDRLVTQITSNEQLQRNTINQTNKLRSDDNLRAINGFKGNI